MSQSHTSESQIGIDDLTPSQIQHVIARLRGWTEYKLLPEMGSAWELLVDMKGGLGWVHPDQWSVWDLEALVEEHDRSAPLAICRCWLKVQQDEQDANPSYKGSSMSVAEAIEEATDANP